MYALIDTNTDEIVQGPWRNLPGRLEWPGTAIQVSPAIVGAQHEDLLIVEFSDEDAPPTRFHTETSTTRSRVGNQVLVSRDYVQTETPTPADIKAEARRRILEQYPEWKQANITARALELQDVWRHAGSWSVEEQVGADAISAAWDWIRQIRQRSDELEGTLPLDFTENLHWELS